MGTTVWGLYLSSILTTWQMEGGQWDVLQMILSEKLRATCLEVELQLHQKKMAPNQTSCTRAWTRRLHETNIKTIVPPFFYSLNIVVHLVPRCVGSLIFCSCLVTPEWGISNTFSALRLVFLNLEYVHDRFQFCNHATHIHAACFVPFHWPICREIFFSTKPKCLIIEGASTEQLWQTNLVLRCTTGIGQCHVFFRRHSGLYKPAGLLCKKWCSANVVMFFITCILVLVNGVVIWLVSKQRQNRWSSPACWRFLVSGYCWQSRPHKMEGRVEFANYHLAICPASWLCTQLNKRWKDLSKWANNGPKPVFKNGYVEPRWVGCLQKLSANSRYK